MWHTLAGLPIKPDTITMPYFNNSEIGFKKESMKGIDLSEVEKIQQRYKKYTRTGEMKLITYPSDGGSIKDIETELFNLEYYEGFIPDVLVVDYADILKPDSDRMEYRHQLDSTWKSLRGLAQEKSILVVTGSQTNRGGMYRDARGDDVAEDIRKLAHVTKMISLNQNEKEKEDGIMRIEAMVQREGRMFNGQIVVLQCYDIGRPYLDSRFKKDVDMKRYQDSPEDKKK
jgi:hypothetical protein